MVSHPSVMFVDDKSVPGGGQLGLERFLRWEDRDLTCSLVVFEDGPLADAAMQAGVDVTVLGSRGQSPSYRARINGLTRAVWKKRPSLVVANSLTAAIFLAVCPMPRGTRRVAYLRQDALPAELGRLRATFMRHVGYRRFAGFLANSEWTARTLPKASRRRGAPVLIAHPISGVARARAVDSLLAPTVPLRVLSMSRLSPWKGIDTIINAARELEDTGYAEKIVIDIAGGDHFGEAEYGDSMRAAAAELTLPVNFLGHVHDIDSVLDSHHVLLCPSSTPEPFGQVIVQGMAHGLATIATNQGGALEIIKNERSGLLVPPRDPAALAEAIARLADDHAQLSSLRRGGLDASASFTDSITCAALESQLSLLIRGARSSVGTRSSEGSR